MLCLQEGLHAHCEGDDAWSAWFRQGSREGDIRLGVMPGDLPGVILPGVLPRPSKSRSGAYCTCTTPNSLSQTSSFAYSHAGSLPS